MNQLLLDDEIVVLSVCELTGQELPSVDAVWSGRVREIEKDRILMSVRTNGGAEVLVRAQASEFRQRVPGRWEVVLPMTHRRIDFMD